MGSKNGIDPKNIIMVNFEEIQKDARKAFEECKKASEGKELRGKKAWEELELQQFLSSFKKDQHGVVTQVKEIMLPSLGEKQTEVPSIVSNPVASNSDLANLIDTSICAHIDNKHDALSKNFSDITNTHLQGIEVKLDKQSIGNNVNASTSNAEKNKDDSLDSPSNWQIPRVPIG